VANAKGVFPSSQVLVTVTVQDVNDNSPTFSESVYHGTVSDCALPAAVIAMDSLITVTDLDQVPASSAATSVTSFMYLMLNSVTLTTQYCHTLRTCLATRVISATRRRM